MEATLSERIERFVLFGNIGNQEDRTFFGNYLKALLGKGTLEEPTSIPEHLLPYVQAVEDILLTPGLQERMERYPLIREKTLTEVLDYLDGIALQRPPKKKFRLNLSLSFFSSGKQKKKEQGGKGKKKKQGKMGQLSSSLSDMMDKMLNNRNKQQRFKKSLQKKSENVERIMHLSRFLKHGDSPKWGDFAGKWTESNLESLHKYEALLNDQQSIKTLARLLGKYSGALHAQEEESLKTIAIKPFRRTLSKGRKQLVGVTENNDLAHLLPSEIALLGNPETEAIFYKKFAEKKLQTFELKGSSQDKKEEKEQKEKQKTNKEQKGPVILCVDTSASMMGKQEEIAKMLSLAILKEAIKEDRKCLLMAFSKEVKTLDLSDATHNMDTLLQFLSMSFHGGTDPNEALTQGVEYMHQEAFHTADLLLISDGRIPVPDNYTRVRILTAQQKGNRFFHIMIANNAQTGKINEFNANWYYNPKSEHSLKEIALSLKQLQRPLS
ncbi:VWA domain-containing protein [Algivirga pacifica]|uniref:VWFA domain-containing protein n=1 Tax=Algivirga pacifica TaxID=1162670 RepID=A0ABP9DM17_9BACT